MGTDNSRIGDRVKYNSDKITFEVGSPDEVTFESNDIVWFGTTSPNQKLDVETGARNVGASEVKFEDVGGIYQYSYPDQKLEKRSSSYNLESSLMRIAEALERIANVLEVERCDI
jgi:hypothetical protein